MDKENYDKFQKIVNLEAFNDSFSELRKIDKEKTDEIEKSLKACIKETHAELMNSDEDSTEIRFLLYKERVELKAHASSYLSYSEMMATRENALWRFAFDLTNQFFNIISDALADYFDQKIEIMGSEITEEHDWYTGLVDSGKKAGSILNVSKKILKKGLDQLDDSILDNSEIVDTKSHIEQTLKKHLNLDQVSKDIGNIMEGAGKRYKDRWEQEIKTQAPDLSKLQAFSPADNVEMQIAFEFGAAEQTLIVGISSAILGSVGLAAGWHTLSYALLNVFPPIALFAAIGTLFVAFWTKDKALQSKFKQVKEAVNQYHKQFLLQIETGRIEGLGNQTLREAMGDQSKQIIKETLILWGKMISGNLTVEHYRILISGFEKHLACIDDYIGDLDKKKVVH